jgi:hypothetical protein
VADIKKEQSKEAVKPVARDEERSENAQVHVLKGEVNISREQKVLDGILAVVQGRMGGTDLRLMVERLVPTTRAEAIVFCEHVRKMRMAAEAAEATANEMSLRTV